MENRTVILVSHHVQLVAPDAAFVLALDNGGVTYQGNDFVGSDIYQQLIGISKEVADGVEGEEEENEIAEVIQEAKRGPPKGRLATLKDAESQPPSAETSETSDAEGDSDDDSDQGLKEESEKKKPPRKLISEEERSKGRVKLNVWVYYLKANGPILFWMIFLFAFLGSKLVDVAETWWLSVWAGSYDSRRGKSRHSVDYYLGIYAIVALANVTVSTFRWLILYHGGITASTSLYKKLLRNVLRAPLRWFDITAHG
jgi:hypothetical protein